ncbi:MAG TPA: hypothetical protein EYG99_00105 [Candidatus Pacebacteria bacterium]|nr:hypothetical protein [Candidatus Paceibacterota bacterium]
MQIMKNVRFKVKDVSFRSSVSNVRPVWTACCDGYGDIHTKKVIFIFAMISLLLILFILEVIILAVL